MALLSNLKSDVMFKALNQELNNRYGKGVLYKNYDHLSFHGETYTHVTEDRIKRTIEIDKLALDRGGDPIRLLSEDHIHRLQSMNFPSYPIKPELSPTSLPNDWVETREGITPRECVNNIPSYASPASLLVEREARQARQAIKQGFEPNYGCGETPAKPKKKSKWVGDIRKLLQKETNDWLKSVQKEAD